MNRKHPPANAHNPIAILTVVLVITWAVLAGLGWLSYRSYQETKTTTERRLRIEELRGSIVHLDEVLTMSARMAAFTGDLEWENRYRRFEPQLDAAIKEAMTLAPEAYGGEAAAESAAANIKLVDMENRTFDLVRQGHADQAKAVLFSDEYEKQKQVYAQGMTRFAKPKERYLRLTELRGTIVHLDEVLRKSARSAAATGDPRWEERYRRFEPQLDAAIKEAIALASGAHSGEAAAETDAANIKLVEIENHAFDLVRQGRAEEAKAVLFGDEYESQKRIYAEGMNEFATGLADAVSASLKREQRLSSLLVGAECLLMPFLIVAWLVVFRAVRNWKTTLAKQAEELVEVNESLDQKVAERTEALRNEVTERKQVEQSLRRSEAKHRVLFESSRDAIMTLAPPSWKFTSGNPATVEMFGARDETEFVSLGPRELSPEFQPDGRPSSEKAREMIETAMKEGASFFEWQHKRLHGQEFPATVLITRVELGDQVFLQATVRDISERKRAEAKLRESQEFLQTVIDAIPDAMIVVGSDYRIALANRAARRLSGDKDPVTDCLTCHQVLRNSDAPCEGLTSPCPLEQAIVTKAPVCVEHIHHDPEGNEVSIEVSSAPVFDETGEVVQIVESCRDVTERKNTDAKQKQLQCELVHAQKLESVGQLAAGIAHEINTPTQYVGDNTRFLKEAFGDISSVLEEFEKLLQAAKDGSVDDQLVAEVEATLKQADIEYLKEEIPQAIDQSLSGVERVAKIVRAMKEFSHPGGEEKSLVNLTEAIETTITVARNEWKYVAEIATEFDPELPEVSCLPGELNQVFLNLIVNAAHAIGDTLGDDATEKGTITVGTRRDGDSAEIFVRDTGTGIPEDVRARVFDPFFTTKEVGKGTGQGLAIARSVVVDKHGGTIDCETEQGEGTTFIVRLPISQSHDTREVEHAGFSS